MNLLLTLRIAILNCAPVQLKQVFFLFTLVFPLYTELLAQSVTQSTSFQKLPLNNIKIEGYLGEKITLCINNRIERQDVDQLVKPFTSRTETQLWQTEFWGKWITSAIAAYEYSNNPKLKLKIDYAVKALLQTQTEDGYIGNYASTAHLQGWDVWGRKYTLLGLLAYHDLTGDKKSLMAAKKVLDHLMTEVGPGKTSIVKTGNYRGMPSSSILEPVMLLYNKTKEPKYLDFAKYIVEEWETPEGPKLISYALAGTPVAERFPHPKEWWTWENGQKAYEMMSCYEGLLELYKITGEQSYLNAVEMAVKNIIQDEINIAGSGAAFECWFHGSERQVHPYYHMMETCVTMTWMKLCQNLLLVTGNPLYADQVEASTYNALLAAMMPNGDTFSKYSPLEGHRSLGEGQCGLDINCCIANGPRGVLLIPEFAIMKKEQGIVVNLYSQLKAVVQLNKKNSVEIEEVTNYPVSESISIKVNPQVPESFDLSLRIPAWSTKHPIYVNGVLTEAKGSGQYATLRRQWKKGDEVTLTLELAGRVIKKGAFNAIMRGPVVLARDSRAAEESIDESGRPEAKGNIIELKSGTPPHANKVLMAFSAPFTLGTNLEINDGVSYVQFIDYASAGNNWDKSNKFRVWIPEPINVMHAPYKGY